MAIFGELCATKGNLVAPTAQATAVAYRSTQDRARVHRPSFCQYDSQP